MEAQDHNLLVVSLDNCITSGGNLGKANSCIYTAAMSSGACGHESSMLELATPVQCLGTAIPRLQHQHLAQLQTVQYPQAVSYEPAQPHGNILTRHAIYQSMSAGGPLHHYAQPPPPLGNSSYLNTAIGQIHLAPAPSHLAQMISHPPDTHLLAQTPTPENVEPDQTEPTFPEDDFEYYKEIHCYLNSDEFPQGVSENYKKHLRKRAQHYMVLDGKLYHSRKQPKEVVMKKAEQQDLLKNVHIVKETGVHLGVKKMFGKLQTKYFWRGMYIDAVMFVKNCEKCSDIVDMARQKQLQGEEDDADNLAGVTQCTVATQCLETWKMWKKVEVRIHGPLNRTFKEHKHLLTVADPESRWVVACPIKLDSDVASPAASVGDFLFHTFCSYGFAQCSLVGFPVELKDLLAEELRLKTRSLAEIALSLIDESEAACPWVSKLVENLVVEYPEWDQNLNRFLFKYRTGQLSSFSSPSGSTPFSLLFNHDPLLGCSEFEENKENVDEECTMRLKKRKPQNSILTCEHCEEVFTSKISFRIHQRRHLENKLAAGQGARRSLRGEKKKTSRKGVLKTPLSTPSTSKPELDDSVEFKPPEACVENTVSAVKALLAATKEERRRRGKYHKYTPELQERMVTYAVKHGNQQAVRFFSERLGTLVSESTIRNLVKVHSAFKPSLKEDIGRFAANFGVEPAARYFSDKLQLDISHSLVRKFKTIHLQKLPETNKKQKEAGNKSKDFQKKCATKKDSISMSSGKGKRFSVKLKEEIGFYACHHSIPDTIKHYSDRVQEPLKERTIKRFLNAYLDKYHVQADDVEMNSQSVAESHGSVQLAVPVHPQRPLAHSFSVYTEAPFAQHILSAPIGAATGLPPEPSPPTQLPIYQLNHCSVINDAYHSPASSVIMTQSNGPIHYQNINSIQNFQAPQQIYSPHHTTQVEPAPSYVMTQHPLIVSQESTGNNANNIPEHFMVNQNSGDNRESEQARSPLQVKNINAADESVTFLSIKCDAQNIVDQRETGDGGQELLQAAESFSPPTNGGLEESKRLVTTCEILEESELDEDDLHEEEDFEDDEEEEPLSRRLPGKKRKSKKEETPKKRGNYTAYSPELRAEIGKYAAEHGSVRARQHFGKILGHELPESTARGLSTKYMRKKAHCKVTSLGYSQRGRPLRLGKYDEVVQGCLKELIRSGEKVSSFLAITTAKQILNNCEPELLEENGGPIKLNTTWAKSFLKRIGVHNNS